MADAGCDCTPVDPDGDPAPVVANFETSPTEDCVFTPLEIKQNVPCGEGLSEFSLTLSGGVFTIDWDGGQFTVALADIIAAGDCCTFSVPMTVVSWPDWACDFTNASVTFNSGCYDPYWVDFSVGFSAFGIKNFAQCGCPENCGALNGGPKALSKYSGPGDSADWSQNSLVKPCNYVEGFELNQGYYALWAAAPGVQGQLDGYVSIKSGSARWQWQGSGILPADWNPSITDPNERAWVYFRENPVLLSPTGVWPSNDGYFCDFSSAEIYVYPYKYYPYPQTGNNGYDEQCQYDLGGDRTDFCNWQGSWRTIILHIEDDWIHYGDNGTYNQVWIPAGDYHIPARSDLGYESCLRNAITGVSTSAGDVDIYIEFGQTADSIGYTWDKNWKVTVYNTTVQTGLPGDPFSSPLIARSDDVIAPKCPQGGTLCDQFTGADAVGCVSPGFADCVGEIQY